MGAPLRKIVSPQKLPWSTPKLVEVAPTKELLAFLRAQNPHLSFAEAERRLNILS